MIEGVAGCVIYESPGDNTFIQVASMLLGVGIGAGSSAVCNVDAAGVEEYLARAASGLGIRVFRAAAPGNWQLVGYTYGPGGSFYSFDLNENGTPEIVWQYMTTRIFEHPGTTTDPRFDPTLPPGALDIAPNPCRVHATLRLAPRSDTAARLAVFDVRGRIVEQRVIESSGAPILWQPRGLPAGVYLVRLENSNGRVIASGRGTVVR